jgi:hypothetical protein
MHPTTEHPILAGLQILPVDSLPEYVIGFPVYVAITVHARPNVSFERLRFADFLNLRESIGVHIADVEGGYSAQYEPTPMIPHEPGAIADRLGSGETRRMLTDVSPLIGNGIVEGEYQARFSYVTPYAAYEAPPVTLRFRKPTAAEEALLATAAPDRARFPNWALWTMSCSHAVYDDSIEPENPLRFNLLLQRLLCGPEQLDKIDPAILDVLTGLFAPEGDALKAELHHARNDIEGYQHSKADVLRATPGLEWWMNMLDGGGAYLKTFRRRE